MFKANNKSKDELDRAGRMVLLATARDNEAVEAAALSPFLFARVRRAIADSPRRDDATGWLTLFFVARRAIPAMALIAILTAIMTVWSMSSSAPPAGFGLYDEALSDTRDPGVEQTVLTRNTLSSDDVLSIVVDRGDREKR
jgi:hypothetical protein